ncbi:MAG TPA: hypothetical protein PLN21_16650 [Gemmatales bacterium]|nr:hypothetical protein [Gemmatales bacterium]
MRKKKVVSNSIPAVEARGKEAVQRFTEKAELCARAHQTQQTRARLIAQGSLLFPLGEPPEHQERLCQEVSRLRRSRIIGLIANDIARDIFQEMSRRSSKGAGTGPELNSQ